MVQARDIVQWQSESLAYTKLWVQPPALQGKPDMVTWCYNCNPTRNGLADMLP